MLSELEQYICSLDDVDHKMIDNRVAEKGIEGYLTQQLVYLDCTRVINGMRMMQTIGYPYQREISSYLYVLDKLEEYNGLSSDEEVRYYTNLLLERHRANLEYEKENPPVWYGGKKAKDKWDKEHKSGKLPRKRKVKEQTIPGMGKEVAAAERLKRLSAQFGNLTFKLKINK